MPQPNWEYHRQVLQSISKKKDSRSDFVLIFWSWKFTIFRNQPPKIGKIGVFGHGLQHPVPFYHVWQKMRHGQIGNNTAKFWIPLWRGKIAGQFLHWNFEIGYSQFFVINNAQLARNVFFANKKMHRLKMVNFAKSIMIFFITNVKVSMQIMTK